ncbi:Alpha/Beta hydrolase protein [Exophiala viscosa]|uniref:Alpha/Beta hydrolase protein n=1 Tax=Exophiala viscosa TaxID=2486360 RepID=UPI0021A151F8|nr:Alpha/Beta hydrolase protein [Exophiala viscosa]
MPSAPPSTTAEILETGTIDPAFAAALESEPIPAGTSYSLADLKQQSASALASLQQRLSASRPPDITETQHFISLRDNYPSRIIICHSTSALESTTPAPLIVLFHGGGHCVGHPENELPLARELASPHSAIVICASYRLAPEFPFPFSICDAWETLEFAASESRKSNSAILPRCTDARTGFIVGGTSSGANLAASLAHLARDHNLFPPLTGQFLCAGSYISSMNVPAKYKDQYLSFEQNRNAPMLDEATFKMFREAFKPDLSSKLYASFDQHHPLDEGMRSVRHGHLGVAPAYFQVCGMDMFRDDGLIYERVLREECGVSTRLDLYAGWGHGWWSLSPELEMSRKRMSDAVDGVGWLLDEGKKKDGC